MTSKKIDIKKVEKNTCNNKIQVHMVAIAKNEYDYIVDWVKYHLRMGIDKIVVYDNNDINGERYDDILKPWIEKGKVELRDRRGLKAQQKLVYREYYKENPGFDWLLILDLDEFLWFGDNSKFTNIKDFINSFDENVDEISLYWQCYGDGGNFDYENKPVYKRFKKPLPLDYCDRDQTLIYNCWYKTIHKAGLDVILTEHGREDLNPNINQVNALGNKFAQAVSKDIIASTYEVAYVRHFLSKSIKEWEKCKLRRGAALENLDNNFFALNRLKKHGWSYDFDTFIQMNGIDNEKLKFLNSLGYEITVDFSPRVLLYRYFPKNNLIVHHKEISDNLNNCSHVKANWLLNRAEFPQELGNKVEFDSKGDFIFAAMSWADKNYDIEFLHRMDINLNNLGSDINVIVSIGAPTDLSEENIEFYNKQVDMMFGNIDNLKLMMQTAILKNAIITPKMGIVDYNETYNKNQAFKDMFDKISTDMDANANNQHLLIKNNVFIAAYKPFYQHLVGKKLPMGDIDNTTIIDIVNKGTICEYQMYQMAYTRYFDDILFIE